MCGVMAKLLFMNDLYDVFFGKRRPAEQVSGRSALFTSMGKCFVAHGDMRYGSAHVATHAPLAGRATATAHGHGGAGHG